MATFIRPRLVAGVSILIALATAATSAANAPAQQTPRFAAAKARKPLFFTGCTGVGPGSFVGINNCNITVGRDSLAVGGFTNTAVPDYAAVVGGNTNTIWNGDGGFIGAGFSNQFSGFESGSRGYASVIVGGYGNAMDSSYASILGGRYNVVGEAFSPYANTDFSVIAGGSTNSVLGVASAIVGGQLNASQARQDFIGGGYSNQITVTSSGGVNGGADAVIAGGAYNKVASATPNAAYWGTIGGGLRNTLTGIGATIPGGVSNTAAGANSFAAGTASYAKNDGSFVFSDDAASAKQLVTNGVNEFLVRASGGFALYSNAALTSGVVLRAGSGSWASLSDRASKTNIVALNPDAVLAKVAALPISEWSYRSEDAAIRHVGPMAQDFYAAFGIGEDNRHITAIDEDGVALAAIKGLAAELKSKSDEVADLKASVRKLQADVAVLLARRK